MHYKHPVSEYRGGINIDKTEMPFALGFLVNRKRVLESTKYTEFISNVYRAAWWHYNQVPYQTDKWCKDIDIEQHLCEGKVR